jgi:hypothetical protein
LTRLEGTAGFLVVLVSVFGGIICFFATARGSDALVAFVAVALAVVALVDPVALVDAAFDVDDFKAELFNAEVFAALGFVVVLFGAGFEAFSGSRSVLLPRPRRAGALRTLAFMSGSGAFSSPLACARCARVRTIMNNLLEIYRRGVVL